MVNHHQISSQPRLPYSIRRRIGVFVAVGTIVAVFAILSVVAAGYVHREIIDRAQMYFDMQVQQLQEELADRILVSRYTARSARALIYSSVEVTEQEWTSYSKALQLLESLGGFQGMLLVDKDPSADRYIVRHESFTGEDSPDLRGQNLFLNESWRRAIEQARDSNSVYISDFAGAEKPYAISFLPLYRNGSDPDTLERRREDVVGMVALIQTLVGEQITELFRNDPYIPGVRLAAWEPEPTYESENNIYATITAGPIGFRRTIHESFLQRMLSIDIIAPAGYAMARFSNISYIIAGLVIFLLGIGIAYYVYFIESARRKTANKVEEATTELVKQQGTLRDALANAQRFRQAVEQSADHIIFADPEGMLIYANPAVETVTGFSPREILGKKVGSAELWGGHMSREFYQQLWHTVKEEKLPFRGEIRNRRKDGTFYDALTVISPILDDAGNLQYFVATERDISREKQLERLQNEFVSIASHQLRTPLGGIRWVAERLMRKEQLSEDGYKYLQDILASASNLSDLIDLLLNVSRLEQEGGPGVRPESLELVHFLEQLLSEMAPIADKKGIVMNLSTGVGEIQMQTDRAALRNIVQTYLSNGLEYTPSGGRVDVRIDVIQDDVRLSVRDTGIGVPKESQNKIFTKFNRGENARQMKPGGTGLGLYLAKKAAQLLGGLVWFESEEGKGSTFYAQIPRISKAVIGGGKPLA